MQLFTVSLVLLSCIICCIASLDDIGSFANVSMVPTGFLPHDTSLFNLRLRQYECSIPGGLPCSDPQFCCAPGEHCCGSPPVGCCPNSDNCAVLRGQNQCCPTIAQTCGGAACCEPRGVCCTASPTGCCIAQAVCCPGSAITPCCPSGSTCCGDTCCLSNEICERRTCISAALQRRIVRFSYDENRNGALLRNMCNGMRGENTIELTYRGKISDQAKNQIRSDAGCVGGYCRGMINAGTITSNLNSCDEFPPASSMEGGNTLPTIQRAINCIPGTQNSHQGALFSNMVQRSGLQQGDKFVISIDCDEVLGSIVPRETVSASGSGSDFYNSTLAGVNGTSYLIAGFGDLAGGTYSAIVKCTSGSITGMVVLDNLGDSYATVTSGLSTGGSQQVDFTLGAQLMGVGLIVSTNDSSTNITWTLTGNILSNSTGANSPNSSNLPDSTSSQSSGDVFSPNIWIAALVASCASITMSLFF